MSAKVASKVAVKLGGWNELRDEFIHRDDEGQSSEEIAAELGISLRAVQRDIRAWSRAGLIVHGRRWVMDSIGRSLPIPVYRRVK